MTTKPSMNVIPMKPETLTVLLALLEGPRHGYAILTAAQADPGARGELQPGSLYRLLARLLDNGLVAELEAEEAPEDADSRRRYYRITALGRDAVVAESDRMQAMVESARRRLRSAGGDL
jgi:DNA-binding PadR family transcriptional regulator